MKYQIHIILNFPRSRYPRRMVWYRKPQFSLDKHKQHEVMSNRTSCLLMRSSPARLRKKKNIMFAKMKQ